MYLKKMNINKKAFQIITFHKKDSRCVTIIHFLGKKINIEISAVRQNVNIGYNRINNHRIAIWQRIAIILIMVGIVIK